MTVVLLLQCSAIRTYIWEKVGCLVDLLTPNLMTSLPSGWVHIDTTHSLGCFIDVCLVNDRAWLGVLYQYRRSFRRGRAWTLTIVILVYWAIRICLDYHTTSVLFSLHCVFIFPALEYSLRLSMAVDTFIRSDTYSRYGTHIVPCRQYVQPSCSGLPIQWVRDPLSFLKNSKLIHSWLSYQY